MDTQQLDASAASPTTRRPARQYAVVAAGIASALAIAWLLIGMPGVPLDDGGYSCGEYTASVASGKVVTINGTDAGTPAVVAWDGARRSGDHRFTVSVEYADGSTGSISCLAL